MKKIFMMLCFVAITQSICFPVGMRERDDEKAGYAMLPLEKTVQNYEDQKPSPNLVRALEEANRKYKEMIDNGEINYNVHYVQTLVTEIENKEYHDEKELKELFARAILTTSCIGKSTHNRLLFRVQWAAEDKTGIHTFSRPICSLTSEERSGKERSIYRLLTIINGMMTNKFCHYNNQANEFGTTVSIDNMQCLADGTVLKDGSPCDLGKTIDLRAARAIYGSVWSSFVDVDHPDNDDENGGTHIINYDLQNTSCCAIL